MTLGSLRVLIVDDEALGRQRLRQLLGKLEDIDIIGECADGTEAVQAIERDQPDLVLLDIQMPELDGFGVIETVGTDRMPAVIFVTAYDQYALQAFEAQAVDYLLKPFDPDRFTRAIERVRRLLASDARQQSMPQLENLLAQVRQEKPYPDRFLLKAGDRHVLVRAAMIQWVEAEDNYVRVHVEGRSYLMRATMTAIQNRLDPRRFRRIHRSAIVNLDFVQELQPWGGGDHMVLMKDGTKLTLSRSYRDQFAEWM